MSVPAGLHLVAMPGREVHEQHDIGRREDSGNTYIPCATSTQSRCDEPQLEDDFTKIIRVA